MAFGENKANAVVRAVEGDVGEDCAASLLQRHPDATMYVDAAASAGEPKDHLTSRYKVLPFLCSNGQHF